MMKSNDAFPEISAIVTEPRRRIELVVNPVSHNIDLIMKIR